MSLRANQPALPALPALPDRSALGGHNVHLPLTTTTHRRRLGRRLCASPMGVRRVARDDQDEHAFDVREVEPIAQYSASAPLLAAVKQEGADDVRRLLTPPSR